MRYRQMFEDGSLGHAVDRLGGRGDLPSSALPGASRAADLASHFRVLYVFAILPALVTYLPKPRRKAALAACLALVLVVDCARSPCCIYQCPFVVRLLRVSLPSACFSSTLG